jgi:hypothetical protein
VYEAFNRPYHSSDEEEDPSDEVEVVYANSLHKLEMVSANRRTRHDERAAEGKQGTQRK